MRSSVACAESKGKNFVSLLHRVFSQPLNYLHRRIAATVTHMLTAGTRSHSVLPAYRQTFRTPLGVHLANDGYFAPFLSTINASTLNTQSQSLIICPEPRDMDILSILNTPSPPPSGTPFAGPGTNPGMPLVLHLHGCVVQRTLLKPLLSPTHHIHGMLKLSCYKAQRLHRLTITGITCRHLPVATSQRSWGTTRQSRYDALFNLAHRDV